MTRLACLALALLPLVVQAAPTRVADIFPGAQSGVITNNLASLDGVAIFGADDGAHGYEIWRSDGTAAGTFMLKDIWPGISASSPGFMARLGDTLYFSAFNVEFGHELWKTDGTPAGTVIVKDINPGGAPSMANRAVAYRGAIHFFTVFGLWKTDGTEQGTVQVAPIPPNNPAVSSATVAGDSLYFTTPGDDQGGHTGALWRYDGATLSLVQRNIGRYTEVGGAVGGSLLFSPYESPFEGPGALQPAQELWITDGTAAGTRLLKDIYPGAEGANPRNFTPYGGFIYFVANDASGPGRLYRTDGTTEGTQKVDGLPGELFAHPLAVHGGYLYIGTRGPAGLAGLYRTDGTAAGTTHVHDFLQQGYEMPSAFLSAEGLLYMVARDNAGSELWILEPPDRTPDALAFASRPDAPLGAMVRSAPVTFSGINTLTPVSVAGGEYSLGCAGTFTSAPGFVAPNQAVCVRHATPNAPLQSTTTTLTLGGVAVPFTSTTAATQAAAQVTSYYYGILRRAPDPGAVDYWQAEAARVQALGADPAEVWYSLAMSFFSSPEYQSFNRNPTEYVRDLYEAFFERAADDAGLAYWTANLAQGLPRDVVLMSFLFSPEFTSRMRAIFGGAAARAEVDVVMDFYRGLLGRLPDSGGFNAWVSRFRAAQCGGAGAVTAEIEAISSAFLNSAEYAARGRTHAQFVGDMYNAFLRRGGDLQGVLYWMNSLQTGRLDREGVRRAFITTPEFSARVAAVVAQGCQAGATR